jgi:adenylate cyclase class IV
MRIEQTKRYRINKEDAEQIKSNLIDIPNTSILMDKRLMIRTLFDLGEQTKNWVRVRIGDVNHESKEIISITYKKMVEYSNDYREAVTDLKVGDEEEAVELLEQIGLSRRSKQETKRSKFLCHYKGEDILVCLDEWPWLDKFRFISFRAIGGIEPAILSEFEEQLGVNNMQSYKGGVDATYKDELGFAVSDCEDVRFGIPVPQK